MNNANLKLSPVKIDQLDQVTKIHMDGFSDSFLSQVGSAAVRKYYEWLMTPPNECHAIGACDGEKLLGFCFAGVFRNAEVHFIKENKIFLVGQIIKKPSVWFSRKLWERLRSSLAAFMDYFKPKSKEKLRKLNAARKGRYGILSIAVNNASQGQGVGALLEKETERIARLGGFSKMVLSVHPENQKAIMFYKNRGWREIIPDPSKPWQGLMEKMITPEE